MEKFNYSENRDNLAKNLKAIPDHEDRKEALEKIENSWTYQLPKKEHLRVLANKEKIKSRPPWKTIKLGEGGLSEGSNLLETLKQNDFLVSKDAKDLLSKIKNSPTIQSIDLDFASVDDLGFHSANILEIIERGRIFGLEPCPPEVGPQLRLQIKRSGYGEEKELFIAMTPIIDSDNDPGIFAVEDQEILKASLIGHVTLLHGPRHKYWLSAYRAKPEDQFNGKTKFVFAKSKTINPPNF